MNPPPARTVSLSVIAAITLLFAGIGIFLGVHLESAIDTATKIARPHEVQTQLENTKVTLNLLQDAVQDYVIDGADGMRYQYEDAVRALGSETAELHTLTASGLPADDVAQIDELVGGVLSASSAVIHARHTGGAQAVGGLADAGLVALAKARSRIDDAIAAQQELLRQRERALRWDVTRLFGGLIALAAIVLCILAGAVFLIENDLRRQSSAQIVLRSEKEVLEGAVRERSATLAQANRELAWFSKRALQIQERERSSIALELHDQIGQGLAALVLSLARCEREMSGESPAELRSAVQDSIEIARAAYGDVHNLALDLRPTMLDRLGLVPTLQWFARQQARLARCEITVEADAFPVQLPSDLLISAFRIVQEAVSNAARHAHPRHIEIQARYRPGQVELQIRDDGSGFDPEQTASLEEPEPSFGLGLIGMRQRAQDTGGHVSIQSKPGSGTQIVALLPIPGSN